MKDIKLTQEAPIGSATINIDPEKSQKETENLAKKLNVPLRDITKYPMPEEEDMMKAGLFMYQLSLIGSCVDKNLQALIWNMYLNLSNYLKKEGGKDDRTNLESLTKNLNETREYIMTSNNPIFSKLSEGLEKTKDQ